MGLPVSSNCNILLADKKGNMVVVECTPILKKVRAAETFENGSIVCTVNSFTSDEMNHMTMQKEMIMTRTGVTGQY